MGMTVRLIETRYQRWNRRFFVAVVVLVFVGVIAWLFYQTGVFQPPLSQPGH